LRHIVPSDRIAELFDADRGLTADEVDERRLLYGSNDILGDRSSGWGDIARDTARDPMVWLLVATALLFAWLGDYIEASVLGMALVPIVGMDAYLHRRTQVTTEGLAGRLATQARVLREGAVKEIPSVELVPGDLVIVSESESFSADGVLVAGVNLQADESALTGEALPVRKRPFKSAAGESETSLENEYWGAAGTRLLTGEARLRVVFTGGETLYGEIVRFAREGQHERTPLQRAISALVAWLIGIALLVCIVLAATRYYQGFGLLDAFLSAVTLAVAALPEEFPVAFTFFLAVGVYRLAQRQALVRRAVVVENIGRVTCICSDKTGTITEGKVTLAHSLPVETSDAAELRRCAAIASRPGSGDPIDIAVLEGATGPTETLIATFPFTEDRRREASVVRDGDNGFLVAAKGAPETIFAMSVLSPKEKTTWFAKTEELAAAGHKVLACAKKSLSHWSGGEPDRGYQFLGLLAFEDPVRDGVREAVAKAQRAGIRVIMVTGDHLTTAAAIAREIGLGGGTPSVIEGAQMKGLVSSGLKEFDVVARAIPSEKLDLVRALKASGEIVAVTGDGVNDVPALQGADIGIAMGERGTRAAREVASIVLLDDNFRTIVRAISEGRQLFRNLKLSFAYLLMMHMPLVATAALVPFAGFPLLYLPMHVVWLELIIHPTALLVFQELPASDKLDPVQRNRELRFYSWQEWTLIAAIGGLVIAMIVVGYARSLGTSNNVEHARSMALVALVVASATMTAGLSRLRSRGSVTAVLATIGSAVVLVQIPPLARLLHLSPLHIDDWLITGLGGAIVASLAAFIPSLGASARARPNVNG
jgi:Ca2+-transporting ATPase